MIAGNLGIAGILAGANIPTMIGAVKEGKKGKSAGTGAAIGGVMGSGMLLPGPGALIGSKIGKMYDKDREHERKLKYDKN